MPIVACQVMPSSASMRRPAEEIKKINALRMAAIKGDPQVIPLDTWTLFADKTGEPVKDEFPDLLHPNDSGYVKWAAALRPMFATLGFIETDARRLHAGARLREPVQRQRPHRLGPAADERGRQGEREEMAGVRSERGAVAVRHRGGVVRRQDVEP